MAQTFVQKASGEATLQVVPGSPHCSITEPTIKIRYNIEITCDKEVLDEQGFIVDNVTFRSYFTGLSTNPISLSCEKLAMKVAHDFLAMLEPRKEYVRSIKVSIEPFPGVGVEYIAERDTPKPKVEKSKSKIR